MNMLWWIVLVLTYLFLPVFPMLLFRVWGFWIKSLLIVGFFAGSLILLILLDVLPSNWMAGTGATGPSTSEDYAAIYLTPWFIIPIALIFLNFIFSLRARGLREVILKESIMKFSKTVFVKEKIEKIIGIKFIFPNKVGWGKTGWLVLTQDKFFIFDQRGNEILSFDDKSLVSFGNELSLLDLIGGPVKFLKLQLKGGRWLNIVMMRRDFKEIEPQLLGMAPKKLAYADRLMIFLLSSLLILGIAYFLVNQGIISKEAFDKLKFSLIFMFGFQQGTGL